MKNKSLWRVVCDLFFCLIDINVQHSAVTMNFSTIMSTKRLLCTICTYYRVLCIRFCNILLVLVNCFRYRSWHIAY